MSLLGTRCRAVAIGTAVLIMLGSCGRKEKAASREPAPQAKAPAKLSPKDVTADLQGLAYAMTGEVVPATPHHSGVMPRLNGEPEHLRFHFDQDTLAARVDYRQRQLLVYDLEEYGRVFQGADRDSFGGIVRRFGALLDSTPAVIDEVIPTLPYREGRQLFRVQLDYLTPDGGGGARFVSRQATDPSPTTSGTIFYTFQGLVGEYYVAFYWPVSAPELPAWSDPKRSARYLGGLTSAEFNPNLDVLDRLVESIQIQGQGQGSPPSSSP